MIAKTDFETKLSSLHRKITQNKTKHLLVENKLTTLENKIPDLSSLVKKTYYNTKVAETDGKIAKNSFSELIKSFFLYMMRSILDAEDGSQAYLIFQPIQKHIKIVTNTIHFWMEI